MQVKIIVNMKGRENEFRNMAIELIRRFQNDVGEVLITLCSLHSQTIDQYVLNGTITNGRGFHFTLE